MSDDLNERIAKAQADIGARARPGRASTGKGVGVGFKMASDFSAAVIVGLVLGLGVDALFGVSPWGLIVLMMLGFIAGVRNVVATAMAQNAANADDRAAGDHPARNEDGRT
jgi:ATP synthase protein I